MQNVDRAKVLDAIKACPPNLEHMPIELRANHELVMEAVKMFPGALEFASAELRGDRTFVLEIMKHSPIPWLPFVTEALRDDREIV